MKVASILALSLIFSAALITLALGVISPEILPNGNLQNIRTICLLILSTAMFAILVVETEGKVINLILMVPVVTLFYICLSLSIWATMMSMLFKLLGAPFDFVMAQTKKHLESQRPANKTQRHGTTNRGL